MESLTPDQATALWDAGGFVVLTGLPEGSEFGIDGTFHIIRKFSGIKFLPPGLHLIAWSSSTPSSGVFTGAGPSNIPIRHALLRHVTAKQRLILRYDRETELVDVEGGEGVISDDHLRSLDKEMAPYPFDGLETWKSLTSEVSADVLAQVAGEGQGEGRVDGLTSVQGEEEDSDSREMKRELDKMGPRADDTPKLRFVRFNLKRSWREGAVGEEVTRYSKDKSWLLGDVVERQLNGDLGKLLGQIQLSFILLLHLSSYSALMVYKRLLALVCQSPAVLLSPRSYLPTSSTRKVHKAYTALLGILAVQIDALPNGTFDTELPEMDVFYMDQIEALRGALSAAIWGVDAWDQAGREGVVGAWNKLAGSARKWGWEIGELAPVQVEDSEDEEEEGEYAPVVVDL